MRENFGGYSQLMRVFKTNSEKMYAMYTAKENSGVRKGIIPFRYLQCSVGRRKDTRSQECTVAQLVEALCYKPESHGFDSL
jgi:hypothetical protein